MLRSLKAADMSSLQNGRAWPRLTRQLSSRRHALLFEHSDLVHVPVSSSEFWLHLHQERFCFFWGHVFVGRSRPREHARERKRGGQQMRVEVVWQGVRTGRGMGGRTPSHLLMNFWRPSLDCITSWSRRCTSSARRTRLSPRLRSGALSFPLRSFASCRTPRSSASSQRSRSSSDKSGSIAGGGVVVDGPSCGRLAAADSCSEESSESTSSGGSTGCSRGREVDARLI